MTSSSQLPNVLTSPADCCLLSSSNNELVNTSTNAVACCFYPRFFRLLRSVFTFKFWTFFQLNSAKGTTSIIIQLLTYRWCSFSRFLSEKISFLVDWERKAEKARNEDSNDTQYFLMRSSRYRLFVRNSLEQRKPRKSRTSNSLCFSRETHFFSCNEI